jgi:hypothetical protein
VFYRGSYRYLLHDILSAMVTATEAYNKRRTEYRERTFSILPFRAGELLLEAITARTLRALSIASRESNRLRRSLCETLTRMPKATSRLTWIPHMS